MRIHYLSDLHLEFGNQDITLPDGELLILAGDITVARSLDPTKTDAQNRKTRQKAHAFFNQTRERFNTVIYIAGNHEHYGFDIEASADVIHEHITDDRLLFLENQVFETNGIAFLCCTLWADMDRRNPLALRNVGRAMNDFYVIERGGRRFTPNMAAELHDASMAWLRRELAARKNQRVVVVTHHAPSYQCMSAKFANNSINHGFASDLDDLILAHPNIDTWVFGHTHVRVSLTIGSTRVLSNAAGYPGDERHGFDPNTSFEIPNGT
ncbi:MAG: metallophosphoesterase [Hyphomicrobiaceae bacterium]